MHLLCVTAPWVDIPEPALHYILAQCQHFLISECCFGSSLSQFIVVLWPLILKKDHKNNLDMD